MTFIRKAELLELDWINERYDEVAFVHSNFEKEIIAIAEWEGKKAGIGRLVTLDEKNLELGGMYVFPEFRGNGLAKEIVLFLLKQARHQKIYCIPFEHLVPFYQEFGFKSCVNPESAPTELKKKFLWCQEKYSSPTSLLVLQTNP